MQPSILNLFKQTFKEWGDDKVPRLGAALAYYTVFSLAPLLIIAISIAGLVFDQEAARGEVTRQLSTLISDDAAKAINEIIEQSSNERSGIIGTLIGLATLLFGASGVFGQLKDAMNTIWGVEPKPGRGIWGFVQERFFSFTMVLGVGFLLLVSLIISTILDAGKNWLFGEEIGILFQMINLLVSFGIITVVFALLFKFLPDVKMAWRDVWIGAALTAFLFTVGKFAIGQYLSRSSTASTFGAAGSLIIILVWVYYSSQILFFGAEFTQVYANMYGSHVLPDDNAVAVTDAARAEQGLSNRHSPRDHRTPRPATSVGTPQVIVTERFKSLEKQRYLAAVLGFLLAVVAGAFKSLLKDKPVS
ncbi:YihY/virulence factor BrkB family protein [Herpetosiphon geysericola]|uniref:Ribonuclease BN n=1 Tax=Herpetosiphon geysericola TaxID=70996 RepID=A0A0N8GPL1_9CHLR|nr:YihY/virulence factor BrkB family protein [Herpetosiphon geysericola]KPL81202.1 ribonuclease BN [Herpetosiphon geysericola]